MTDEAKCQKCDGCGQIANDEDGTPWKIWAELPPGSDMAVRAGLVRPLPCPECSASKDVVRCPLCSWFMELTPANDPAVLGPLAAVFGITGSTLAAVHSDQNRARDEQKFRQHCSSHGPEEWLPALVAALHARDVAVDALVKSDA